MYVLTSSTPATRDVLKNNVWMNNRSIRFDHVNNYVAIPEINRKENILDKRPDVYIFDFVPDVFFGTVADGKEIKTRNFWTKNYSPKAVNFIDRDSVVSEQFEFELRDFIERLHNAGIQIILNSFRFANSMTKDNEGDYPLNHNFPRESERERMNRELQLMEEYVREQYPYVGIITFDSEHSKNEANHPIKQFSFYMNSNYYLDSFMKFEQLLEPDFPDAFPTYQRLEHFDSPVTGDVLLVKAPRNLIKMAWSDEKVNDFLTYLSNLDFILDGNIGDTFRFIKRNSFWRPDLREYLAHSGNNVYYADDLDPVRHRTGEIKHIVFFFCGMPGPDGLNSLNAEERMFPHLFHNFTRSLTKDTLVVRIADVNGVRGGFYVNTNNYQSQEDDISEFIDFMMNKYQVNANNVVLHGTSKGATGALFYAAKHDLNCVVVDPVLDARDAIMNLHNNHFMRGFRIERNLVPEINRFSRHGKKKRVSYVLGNHYVKETWSVLTTLKGVFLIDIDDKTVTKHPQISPNCVPEWLALINIILFKFHNESR